MIINQRNILITGDDACEFLQGQLSNDIGKIPPENSALAAWCTPKGRVITLFDVQNIAGGFSLLAPEELVESLLKRLTMFRFRAKVTFEAAQTTTAVDLAERIRLGVPWIGLKQTEKFTPHMLNLDALNAISWDKGCYTGQEIVARTHYKGATKRRTLRFSFEDSVTITAGDAVTDAERSVGEILNVAEGQALAVLPLDKSDGALFVNGTQIKRQSLPYEFT